MIIKLLKGIDNLALFYHFIWIVQLHGFAKIPENDSLK